VLSLPFHDAVESSLSRKDDELKWWLHQEALSSYCNWDKKWKCRVCVSNTARQPPHSKDVAGRTIFPVASVPFRTLSPEFQTTTKRHNLLSNNNALAFGSRPVGWQQVALWMMVLVSSRLLFCLEGRAAPFVFRFMQKDLSAYRSHNNDDVNCGRQGRAKCVSYLRNFCVPKILEVRDPLQVRDYVAVLLMRVISRSIQAPTSRRELLLCARPAICTCR